MSADVRSFVDTNVLVYAYDADAGRKHGIARDLLTSLWRSHSGVLSVQVLQEFYVTVTRKLPEPLERATARRIISRYSTWQVYAPGTMDIVRAAELEEEHQLSFWDALIIVAASHVGANRLLSEDFQIGRRIEGLSIENPFAE